MPARALPGTTVRLSSSGVPAIIQVTLAAGIASRRATIARARSVAGDGHVGPERGVHVDAVAGPQLELVQALAAGHHRRAAVVALGEVEVERPVGAQLVAVRGPERAQPRAAELLLALHQQHLAARAAACRRRRAGRPPARPSSSRRRARRCARRRPRPRTARASSPTPAAARRTCRSAGRSGPGPSITPITVGRRSPGSAISAVPPGRLDQLADRGGGGAQVAVGGRHRRDPQEVADALDVGVEVAVDRRVHATRRLDDLERLGVGVEPRPRAERDRRHVLAVADRHVGDRGDAERRDQLVEDLLDREARADVLGDRVVLEVDVRCRTRTRPTSVELAGADQVVEGRVDHVRAPR